MKPLESIYKDSFFRNRFKLHWRAPIFCQAVIDVLNPESVIDVGCATGDLVRQFRQMGVLSDGLEGSKHAVSHSVIPNTIVHDLRTPWDKWKITPYDLCLSLEVLEHVEPEYTDTLLQNLTIFSNRLLLSIALPGQKGHHHVNLQEMDYWDDLFGKLNYQRNQFKADQVKYKIHAWRHKPGIKAFWQNLVYYERTE